MKNYLPGIHGADDSYLSLQAKGRRFECPQQIRFLILIYFQLE